VTIVTAIIFGLIQGFGEMLPISSSAHLVLFPYLFGITDPGLSFDVALHLGTLVAILGYFWREWLDIAISLVKLVRERKVSSQEQKLAGYLIAASIPGALFGYYFGDLAEGAFRNPLLVAIMLVLAGAALWFFDHRDEGKRMLTNISFIDSILIGLAQAIAIVPGVSRSGATITMGLARGISREDAARFSFLMSAPIIAGAAIVKIPELDPSLISTAPFWVAIISATVSSAVAIKALLTFVKKHHFDIFVYYRFALAAVVVITFLMKG
jgi:undecaprenyl-diphosphatase